MSLAFAPNPAESPQPVVIRAHHVEMLSDYLVRGDSFEVSVDATERFTKEAQILPKILPNFLPKRAYHDDVFGPEQDSVQGVKANIVSFYESLMELPDDTRVKVADSQKDAMCTGCFIGNHCEKRMQKDVRFIGAILQGAEMSGLLEDVDTINETVTIRGQEWETTSLELSMRSLKTVLSDPSFQENIGRDPLSRMLRGIVKSGRKPGDIDALR